jgi:hypothetical protein
MIYLNSFTLSFNPLYIFTSYYLLQFFDDEGRVKKTVVPFPGPAVSAHMRPPCFSTIRLQIVKPSPLESIACLDLSTL